MREALYKGLGSKSLIWKAYVRISLLLFPMVAHAGFGGSTSPSPAATKIGKILDNMINFGLGLLIILAVLLIVYTAYMFMTGGGSLGGKDKVSAIQTAKRQLTYVMIGVAVGLLAKVFVAIIFEIADEPVPSSIL